ncbi:oleandomycin transport system ATP-binding protein [Kitasatospora sp. MAA4]|uniref:ABC transporter ATP-binding protein n=1 Tax=Kitasatospora sp. MAA4 TaxID=3035093 RepID=UPI0024753F9A|nr:ABC transporter ATP-binding protein [Kitasatospora sp. MAA4]MDH6135769.1 oleandomycin transport system ATP-binding protein [Kitasatospora sp. MAA4]
MPLTLLTPPQPPAVHGADAVETAGLGVRRGARSVLDGVSLSVRPGNVLAVVGGSGAGKTALLRILATLAAPDAGSAAICGLDTVREAVRVRRLIGLAGGRSRLDDNLTVRQNLYLVGRLTGLDRFAAAVRARELLARLELGAVADRRPTHWPPGLRSRLDLALGLVGRPRVLLLDEPAADLDADAREQLGDVVREVAAGGAAVLFTTRRLQEADRLADEVAVLARGTLAALGTPEQLRTAGGALRLEVRPARPADLDRTAVIATRTLGELPERTAGGRLSFPISDPALPPVVLRDLGRAGVPPTEFALRRSRPDEVLLALTGKPRACATTRRPEGRC